MAGDGWRDVFLEDLAAPIRNALVGGPFGSDLVSNDYQPSGVPVIRGENLSDGRWVSGDFVFVSSEKAKRLEANTAGESDIIFTQRGANHYRQVAVVSPDERHRFLISQSQMKLTVDRRVADPLFVYYLFRAPEQQEYLQRNAISTGVPHTNLSILRKVPLCIPTIDIQLAIVSILGALDDKIELNRRMNETLEAMARALFKSWFVDFDPVRAKAEGRDPGLPMPLADLFPACLVDSELGEIPEGWSISSVHGASEQLRDQTNPFDLPNELFHHYSIPAFDNGQHPVVEFGNMIRSMKFRVPNKTVLFSKLNPEIKRVWLADPDPGDQAICSTEFLVLRPKLPYGRGFVYCLLCSPEFRESVRVVTTGTSNSHQRARADSVLAIPIPRAPATVVEHFEQLVEPIVKRLLASRRESRTLAALRDALLPKLISGEIRVTDAERLIAEAAA